jgi:hypothetical protein
MGTSKGTYIGSRGETMIDYGIEQSKCLPEGTSVLSTSVSYGGCAAASFF